MANLCAPKQIDAAFLRFCGVLDCSGHSIFDTNPHDCNNTRVKSSGLKPSQIRLKKKKKNSSNFKINLFLCMSAWGIKRKQIDS